MAQLNASNISLSRDEAGRRTRYGRYLLIVAGLGGLLYGIDLGIIGGALPYLEATSGLTAEQLSAVVAAVLLGSVFSTLFAGMLCDWFGRRPLMTWSGVAFSISIPIIALSHSFGFLIAGRILQGISGGVIGVVVPLYLAECLPASVRGKGTAFFQWFLTLGIVLSALLGVYYSIRLEEAARTAGAAVLFALRSEAWRRIFWTSLPAGVLFTIGSCFVTESPRWLLRRGDRQSAYSSLLRSRSAEEAFQELEEMTLALSPGGGQSGGRRFADSLFRRRYVIPFLLSCTILFCNTATGINSVTAYDTSLLVQSGLSDLTAHWCYVLFTCVKFLMTMVGVMLVDRKGRKFLLVTGTAGMVVALGVVASLFFHTERINQDCNDQLQSLVTADQTLTLQFDPSTASRLLQRAGTVTQAIDTKHASLAIIYSYGGFTAATRVMRSDDSGAQPIRIRRSECVPSNAILAFFKNPFANLAEARVAPLRIDRAVISRVPPPRFGWTVEIALYIFVAFYSLGPGVCVWLALSELMPTRIRSNGMSAALVINQLVSTTMAAIFLPVVSRYGYSSMFLLFGAFTLAYFLVTAFLLPETKGKSLEEIEELFEVHTASA